ncbi:MAG: 4Fe-4S dicluster domain-containing protein [Candidatus Geothermarchaeales archaeon]
MAEASRVEFISKIEELSGQSLLSCNQCGKCSGGCPSASAMDLLPNQVIRLIQLGREEVLNCKMMWFCASCLVCDSRCPRGIDLSKVMESLRALTLRRGIDFLEIPKISPDLLAQAPQQAFVSGFRKFTSY